jgi:FAD/FMN-containing dehydrogenase
MTSSSDRASVFRESLGADQVLDSLEQREFFAQDVYRRGVTPQLVLRPGSTADVQTIVRLARQTRTALHVRGGGMSYTDAYLPLRAESAVLDLSGLNRIRSIEPEDLLLTAESGCTWAQIDEALRPHGLRARFWGPMSGALATLGGGMSQGAATFGSARHGTSAAAALGFEVVLGTGELLDTAALGRSNVSDAAGDTARETAGDAHTSPRLAFFRPYGPDITGLFLADAGALGIKTAMTLQLEPRPQVRAALSFAFDDFESLQRATAKLLRSGLATEIFGLETSLAKLVAGEQGLAQDIKALWSVSRAQGSVWRALKQAGRMALAGRGFLARSQYIGNVLLEGRDEVRLAADALEVRALLARDGREVANTMAAVVQSSPFPQPMVVGPGGRRLLPLNVILPHTAVTAFHRDFEALRERHRARCEELGVLLFMVFAGVGPSCVLHEPVIYWQDEWLPLHAATLDDSLAEWVKPAAAHPQARDYVEALRLELINLMAMHRGAHLQIGRAYPYLQGRDLVFQKTLAQFKDWVDPDGIINPGALGLQTEHQGPS